MFIWTKGLFALTPLAGGYAAICAITALGLMLLAVVRIPRVAVQASRQRLDRAGLLAVLRRGPVLTAVIAGAVSQGIMVLLIVPRPLVMTGAGHSEALARDVVRWHVVATFAPSFALETGNDSFRFRPSAEAARSRKEGRPALTQT